MTNAAFSYSVVTIDMGDMGTVGLYNNSGGAGLTKYYDTMPTEAEVNAKIQELKDAEQAAIDKKASGKQKLKDLGLDDDEIQALIGV